MSAKTKTNIKLVEKSNILFMRARCTDEHFDEHGFVVIKLTKEIVNRVNELMHIVKIVKQSKDFHKLVYWNTLGGEEWFLHSHDTPEEIEGKIDYWDWSLFYLNKEIKPSVDLCTESHTIQVYEEGIRFMCFVDNTNIELETEVIPFDKFVLDSNAKNK